MGRKTALDLVTEAAEDYQNFTVLAIMEDTGLAHRSVINSLTALVVLGRLDQKSADGTITYFWKRPDHSADPGKEPVVQHRTKTKPDRYDRATAALAERTGFTIADAAETTDQNYATVREVLSVLVIRGVLIMTKDERGMNRYYWPEVAHVAQG